MLMTPRAAAGFAGIKLPFPGGGLIASVFAGLDSAEL
jgi:hypothetical protein